MAAAKPITVDQDQLAQLLDITPRHVRRLVGDGILARARDVDGKELQGRYELVHNVRAYVQFLRKQAKLDDASESRYVMLRNQRMAAETETAELKLAIFKGLLHRSDDVMFIMTNMFTAMRARLLSIPSRVTRLLVGQTNFQVIFDLISGEIEMALRELSEPTPEMFKRHNAAYLASQGADVSSMESNGNGSDGGDESNTPNGA